MDAHNPEKVMDAYEHLAELRRRFLVSLLAFAACFAVAFLGYESIVGLFTGLFRGIESASNAKLFTNTLPEGFLVQLHIAATAALIASLPIHLVNVAQFVFPAVGRRVRRIISGGLFASFALALIGVSICYLYILPWSILFFAGSSFIPRDVGLLLNLRQSVSYILSFTLWAVISFQSPLVLLILLALNILDRKAVFRASRFVIVIIFVISAIVTPSVDPISQCAIALPLIVLYFLSILTAKIFAFGEGKRPADAVKGAG